jgi:hypothetical protein
MAHVSKEHKEFIRLVADSKLELSKHLCINKSIPLRGYYVYVITENNYICYIGKGKNNRVKSHFTDSSNQVLKSKIKENKNIFDWHIIDVFDTEIEAFDLEEDLIIDCKKNKHKLYNKVHYSNYGQYNKEVRSIFNVLNQLEKMVFIDIKRDNILSIHETTKIFFKIINDICLKMKYIPVYMKKPINELNYSLTKIDNYIKVSVS